MTLAQRKDLIALMIGAVLTIGLGIASNIAPVTTLVKTFEGDDGPKEVTIKVTFWKMQVLVTAGGKSTDTKSDMLDVGTDDTKGLIEAGRAFSILPIIVAAGAGAAAVFDAVRGAPKPSVPHVLLFLCALCTVAQWAIILCVFNRPGTVAKYILPSMKEAGFTLSSGFVVAVVTSGAQLVSIGGSAALWLVSAKPAAAGYTAHLGA